MNLPNFLIIGASKSGTTALYHYLRQHPDVFMSPKKEPDFFSYDENEAEFSGPHDAHVVAQTVKTLEDYAALFSTVDGEKAVGEASPSYLAIPRAADRIRNLLPRVRLIAILRNPADRAFSAYMHQVREGREPFATFEQALEAEEDRIRDHWRNFWHYKTDGLYYRQLKRYYNLFEREQIRVYLYEDFIRDPRALIRNIFRFLEVDPSFVPDMSFEPNRSGIIRSRSLHDYLSRQGLLKRVLRPFISQERRLKIMCNIRNWNLVRVRMPEQIRRRLLLEYREDLEKLEELLQRNLSIWYEDPA